MSNNQYVTQSVASRGLLSRLGALAQHYDNKQVTNTQNGRNAGMSSHTHDFQFSPASPPDDFPYPVHTLPTSSHNLRGLSCLQLPTPHQAHALMPWLVLACGPDHHEEACMMAAAHIRSSPGLHHGNGTHTQLINSHTMTRQLCHTPASLLHQNKMIPLVHCLVGHTPQSYQMVVRPHKSMLRSWKRSGHECPSSKHAEPRSLACLHPWIPVAPGQLHPQTCMPHCQ